MSETGHPLGATFAGVLLFIIGLGIAGGVYQINANERALRRDWLRADGTVAENVKRQTAGGAAFAPLIVFRTASGTRVSFTAASGAETPRYAIGDTVPVLYPPMFPERAEIDPRRQRWVRNGIAGAGAVLLMALGGYVAWYASRLQRARAASPRA